MAGHRGRVMMSIESLAAMTLPKGTRVHDARYIMSRKAQLEIIVEHEDLPEEGSTPTVEVEYGRRAAIKGWKGYGEEEPEPEGEENS